MAGILTLAVAVPNAVQGLVKLGLFPTKRQTESMRRSYERLLKSGYLKYEGKHLRLTKKGEQMLLSYELESERHGRQWDGKWRVLVFDIPEKKRSLRIRVRRSLQTIGFLRLQDSVWIYPFDCEDFVVLLKADLRIGYEMLYMIVDQLEGDSRMKREFGLS